MKIGVIGHNYTHGADFVTSENPSVLFDRAANEVCSGLGEVERLYHERIDLYRKAADATLDNSHGYQAGMYGLQKLITTMFNIYA